MSLVVLVALLGLVGLGTGMAGGLLTRGRGGDRLPQLLGWLALAATVVISIILAVGMSTSAVFDPFFLVLVAVPLGCCLVAVRAARWPRRTTPAVAVAAVILVGWSLLTGLGSGLFFLIPALLLVGAAGAAAVRDRPTRRPEAKPLAHS